MAERYVRAELAHKAAEANKLSAASTVQALVAELDYSRMEPSTDADKPVRIMFSLNRDMTVDEARRTVTALRAAGLLK
jgi:hypothetical protein